MRALDWRLVADLCAWAAFGLVLASLTYTAWMLRLSRRPVARPEGEPADAGVDPTVPGADPTVTGVDPTVPGAAPTVVVVMPCLNEGRVIGASIDRLLALDHPDLSILVVDDGSCDNTASIVMGYSHPAVRLLRRVEPNCRQGKGEALNAAYAYLVTSKMLAGRDPRDVIVAVLDADGRLEAHALDDVLPRFADPAVGGVQIGVRINNRHTSWLARMQDLEFVVFTDVFQRARRHLGSVGMGGNGQFMRLAALMSLGDRPWSRSLTEDLDLGVRLLAAGWRTDYCHTASVHQQGLSEWGRLVKQRTRWFQGHLQSWSLLPTVLRETHGRARRDLTYHLTSPLLLLLASVLTLSFVTGLIAQTTGWLNGGPFTGWWLIGAYLLAVVPSIIFAGMYHNREKSHGLSRWRAFWLAHGYVAYCLMWYLAGWRAAWRAFIGRTGWAKTARNVETDDSTLAPDDTTVATDSDVTELTAAGVRDETVIRPARQRS